MEEEAPKELSRPVEQVVVVDADAVESLVAQKVVEEEAKVEDQKLLGSVDNGILNSPEKVAGQSFSFKEESTEVSKLPEAERKVLDELKQLVREALEKRELGREPVVEQTVQVVATDEVAKPEEAKETQLEEKKMGSAENEGAQMGEEHEEDGARTVEAIEETIVAVAVENNEGADGGGSSPSLQVQPQEEVSIWGVPLLADGRSDVILLKFLRARDFKVEAAFSMFKDTIRWRKEFGVEELLDEDLGYGGDLDKVVFMHGHDKEGHPVCYNVYGEFQDKELYQKVFSDEEKRAKFLRYRIQFLERSVRKLDFRPGGVSTILQVNDLKDFPGLSKKELRQATAQALQVLQDNYPEFLAKQVFINVPWWYLAFYKMISPFMTQRTKSKFVFGGPSKTPETLSRYIAAEQVPVQYGGLSKDGEFGTGDAVTEITVKPVSKHTIEFPVTEACLLTWEVRVVGWEVRYAVEFTPSAAESYTVIIQKPRKVAGGEEPVICNSFETGEPGKVVFTIDNPTTKKKKLLYRMKAKPLSCAVTKG